MLALAWSPRLGAGTVVKVWKCAEDDVFVEWFPLGEKDFIGFVPRDKAVLFKGPRADRNKIETFTKNNTRGGDYAERATSALKEVNAAWERLEEAKQKAEEEAKRVKLRAGAQSLQTLFAKGCK